MATSSWCPTSDLRKWLGYGAAGIVFAVILGIASWAVMLATGPQEGFHLADALSLVSMLPLGFAIAAYWKLGLATGSLGLRKSAVGFYGASLLIELFDVHDSTGARIALAIAAIILVIIVWTLKNPRTDGEEPQKSAAEGIGGGLVVLLLVGLKIFAKVGFLQAVPFELWVKGGIFLLAGIFVVWFAIVKILLRRTLGGLSALLGITELAAFVTGVVAASRLAVDIFQAVDRVGMNEKAMEEAIQGVISSWLPSFVVGTIITQTLLAALTIGLFLKLRALCPLPPDPDLEAITARK
jgi:hypothetical protein